MQEISALLEQDETGSYAVAERSRVCLAGMINAVTVKTTRNEERMAFFNLEDRYAEIECLVFPKTYATLADVVRADTAVCVYGTVSYRENEDPKILVDRVMLLIDNDAYADMPKTETPRQNAEQPRQQTPREQTPHRAARVGSTEGKRLYLRLPDSHGLLYRKALALVEILEGNVPVVFYDGSTKTYQAWRGGIALTDYAFGELIGLLGEGNVILK